jgi:hypothetical protein
MDHVERLNSPWTDIKIAHLEGAVSRVPESATACGSRNARLGLVIQARWERGSDSTAQVAWARGLRDALAPCTTGRVYANFIAADEADRVRSAHGPENCCEFFSAVQASQRSLSRNAYHSDEPNADASKRHARELSRPCLARYNRKRARQRARRHDLAGSKWRIDLIAGENVDEMT